MLVQKKLRFKKLWAQKKFKAEKSFGSENIWGPKQLRQNKFLGHIIIFLFTGVISQKYRVSQKKGGLANTTVFALLHS